MEDLCLKGFDTLRGQSITEDGAKMVYSKLAKLHAVSYMLAHTEDHESVTNYRQGLLNISMPILKEMYKTGYSNFLKLLSTYEEFHMYIDKVKAMQDDVEQACKDLYQAYTLTGGKNGDIFVLNHGDFHLRNMMFKFDSSNKMEDVMFLDYQISCYAPSCVDLVYSQFLLLSPESRWRRHEFNQYYFSEFIRILKKLNFQQALPKYSQFQMTSLKYRHLSKSRNGIINCQSILYKQWVIIC